MKYRSVAISSLLVFGVGLSTSASATVVSSFAPFTTTPTAGVWYENDVRFAGEASVVSLVGEGGNLENNQPLPIGAARLTTGASNDDKAEVAVVDAYGNASALFSDVNFSLNYSYYKEAGGNAFAAPTLKLTLLNSVSCSAGGDCFGTLVYEPSWNQTPPGSSVTVPTGDWQSVTITADSGLFWWNGGFGQPNTAGGPPLKTLTDWMAAFDADFDDANLVSMSMGVGTFNQSQDTYFDDVRISSTGYSASYNFEPAAEIPIPSTLLLMGIGILAGASSARKRTRKS